MAPSPRALLAVHLSILILADTNERSRWEHRALLGFERAGVYREKTATNAAISREMLRKSKDDFSEYFLTRTRKLSRLPSPPAQCYHRNTLFFGAFRCFLLPT